MAYVGNQPSGNFVQVTSQTITGNGGATYTLDRPAGNSAELEVFVNNVRQDPASYSVTGTSLTLGGNITSSDSCYVVFQSAGVGTVSHPATANLQAADGTFTGDLSVDTDTLHVDSANSNVGIGLITPSPAYKVHVDGNSNSDGRLARFSQAGTDNAIVDVTAQNGTNTEAVIRYRNDSTYYSVGIDSDDSFAIGESFANTIGNKRLIIDTNGHVTMPKQPAFLAYRTGGDWTTNSGSRIAFTNTHHNVGNGYSTSNYQFTAPVAGRYFFGGQMWAKVNGGMARWHFEHNGTHRGQFGSHSTPQDTANTGATILNLAASDYVTMVVDNGNVTAHAGSSNFHSFFYGYLIG